MLTDHSLRYYKDSIAEEVRGSLRISTWPTLVLLCCALDPGGYEALTVESVVFPKASDLDGEIELSTCYNVTEYQAQRNYGFQIHVRYHFGCGK